MNLKFTFLPFLVMSMIIHSQAQSGFGFFREIGEPNFNRTASAADFDGDGDLDLLASSYSDDALLLFEATSPGIFNAAMVINSNFDFPERVLASDLDGDGDQDVLASSSFGNEVFWLENLGSLTFGPKQILGTGNFGGDILSVDIDNDADQDVLFCWNSDDEIVLFQNDGTGVFTESLITSDLNGIKKIQVADMNSDGNLDLLSVSTNDGKVAWYEGDGSGNFGMQRIISVLSGVWWLEVGDVNLDGRLDFICSQTGDEGQIGWFENLGAGSFNPFSPISDDYHAPDNFISNDLDGDGDLDIVCFSNALQQLIWFENLGAEFSARKVIDGPYNGALVFPADLDDDGSTDIILSDFEDNVLGWYENRVDELPRTVIEHALDLDIRFYPNPVTDLLTVSWSDSQVESLRLISSSGQVFKEVRLNMQNRIQIDLSGIPAGVYQLQVELKELVWSRRIQIN